MAQYAIVTGDDVETGIAGAASDTYDDVQHLSTADMDANEWQDVLKNCTSVMLLGTVDEAVIDYLNDLEGTAVLGDHDVYDDVLPFDYDDMVVDGLYNALDTGPRRTQAQRFAEVVSAEDSWAIGIHDNPDPDAISSAVALKYIVEDHFNGEACIHYGGNIKHQENTALKNVLELDLNQEAIDPAEYDGIAMLDTASIDNISVLDNVGLDRVDFIIDHHTTWSEYDGDQHALFDVRTDRAATASIMADYFQGLGLEPDDTTATALVHGIYADTGRLAPGPTDETDIEAVSFLYPFVDTGSLENILGSQRSLKTLRMMGLAGNTFTPYGTTAVAYLGDVDNVDAMSQAADLLNTYEKGKSAVVAGILDGEYIEIKVRRSDSTIHVGDTLDDMFSDDLDAFEDDRVSAGGHPQMGAGTLPIDLFDVPHELYESDEPDDQELFQEVLERVIGRRFKDFGRDS